MGAFLAAGRVVIDFFIESSVRQELHNYTISILMGNLDGTRFYDIIADHISMGADLLAATPLVTLAILTGSMFSLTSMASRISGKDHVDEKIAAPSVVSNGPLAELSYDKINTPQAQTKPLPRARVPSHLPLRMRSARNRRSAARQ